MTLDEMLRTHAEAARKSTREVQAPPVSRIITSGRRSRRLSIGLGFTTIAVALVALVVFVLSDSIPRTLGPASQGSTTTVTVQTTSTTLPALGAQTPFPADLLPADCAATTVRELATFDGLVDSQPTFAQLCAVVGPPDWVTGSGLMIGVYDLDDGGQLFVAYGGGGPLIHARWVTSDGVEEWLFGG